MPRTHLQGQWALRRYFALLTGGWLGWSFCFAPAIQDEPPQTNWMVDTTVSGTILYTNDSVFCCCVVMFKFPCQFLRKKRGTFLVAKKTTSEGSKKKMTHGEVSCGLCNHSFYVAEHLSHFLLVTLNLIQSRDTLPPTIMDFRRKMGVSP